VSLKIGPVQITGVQRYSEISKKPVAAAALKQEADKVDVSGANKLFAQALSAAKAMPEVRAERVDAVRGAVQNGTYQVNSRLIAEKMLGL
jgi:negative regulator of flagellin synthesis FlgM